MKSRSGIVGGHYSSRVKPDFSWCKNSTVEHAHSPGAIRQWCYCFYAYCAGGSQPASNFLPTISRQM